MPKPVMIIELPYEGDLDLEPLPYRSLSDSLEWLAVDSMPGELPTILTDTVLLWYRFKDEGVDLARCLDSAIVHMRG